MVDPKDHGEREAKLKGDDESDSKDVPVSESRPRDDDETDETDDDDDEDDVGAAASLSEARSGIASGSLNDLARLRREKRLAMNRASARERRRRKKVLVETLEEQVQELTKRNQSLEVTNTNLHARVEQLEVELAQSRAQVTRLETSRVPSHSMSMVNLPDAFAVAAHQESIRNALLAADEAALHQAAAMSVGNQSMAPSSAVASYLGSPSIINDMLAQREILNAQVMAERHRRAAMLENATLNQLRQAQHSQLGLGGLLGQHTLAMPTGSIGMGRAMADPGRMPSSSRKGPTGDIQRSASTSPGDEGKRSPTRRSRESEEKTSKKKSKRSSANT